MQMTVNLRSTAYHDLKNDRRLKRKSEEAQRANNVRVIPACEIEHTNTSPLVGVVRIVI